MRIGAGRQALAEHDSRHWSHLELATAGPWWLDGNPFERRHHPQAPELSLSQRPITNALQIGCPAGTLDENFRRTAAGSRSSLSCREHKLEDANR
ncbi:SAM-dependent methyltransferase [Mesorhizobium sp. 128a]